MTYNNDGPVYSMLNGKPCTGADGGRLGSVSLLCDGDWGLHSFNGCQPECGYGQPVSFAEADGYPPCTEANNQEIYTYAVYCVDAP